jgi:hypothetical protein
MPPSGPPGKKQAPQPSSLRNVLQICSDTSEPHESDDFKYYPSDERVVETQLADQNSTSRHPATEKLTQQPGIRSQATVWERDPTNSLTNSFAFAPSGLSVFSRAIKASPKGYVATSDAATSSKPAEKDIVVIEDGPYSSKSYCSEPLAFTNILWAALPQTTPHLL